MSIIVNYLLSLAIFLMFIAISLAIQSVTMRSQVQPAVIQNQANIKKGFYQVASCTCGLGVAFILIAIMIFWRSNWSLSGGYWMPGGLGLLALGISLFISGKKLDVADAKEFGQGLYKACKGLIIAMAVIMGIGLILELLIALEVVPL